MTAGALDPSRTLDGANGERWLEHLQADPRPWLLAEDTPAVRAAALHQQLDLPPHAAEVTRARAAAMEADPIKMILAAIAWAARTIAGEDVARWYASGTSGPQFACAANDGQPGAWGALKELRALARIPTDRQSTLVRRALDVGGDFRFSCDPAVADYPMGWGNPKPNALWFKPGFPSGYVSDVVQALEVLGDLGYARDQRLAPALTWLETKQDGQGRWLNRYAYNGKTWADIERQGTPSKWVNHEGRLRHHAGEHRHFEPTLDVGAKRHHR